MEKMNLNCDSQLKHKQKWATKPTDERGDWNILQWRSCQPNHEIFKPAC
jgi:hypothetical protein